MQNQNVQNNKQTNQQTKTSKPSVSNLAQEMQPSESCWASALGLVMFTATLTAMPLHGESWGATEEITTSSKFTSIFVSASLAKQPSSLGLWWTCWNPKVMQRSPLLEPCSSSKKQFVCSLNLDRLKNELCRQSLKSFFLRMQSRARGRRSRCSQMFRDCVKLSEVFCATCRCKQEIWASSTNDLVVSV